GQPSVGEAAVYFRLEGDSRNVAQRTLVVFEHRPALTNALVEDAELSTANTRADIAEAVVIADMGVFVVRRTVAGLGSKETRVLHPAFVPRNEGSSAGGGDDLVAVEREDTDVTKGTQRLIIVPRSE